jgi:hypothetical protein
MQLDVESWRCGGIDCPEAACRRRQLRGQTRSLMALESTLVYRWIDRDVYQKSTGRVTTPA